MKQYNAQAFTRRSKNIPLNPALYLATEGTKTEITYVQLVKEIFKKESVRLFKKRIDVNIVKTTKNTHSSPSNRLRELKRAVQASQGAEYSAWLVCDRDEWRQDQFDEIRRWVDSDLKRNRWILNAPRFEFWLKLHFDESTPEGKSALKKFHLDDHKVIRENDITYQQVVMATQKARRLYERENDLFAGNGSNMFLLIEFLAKAYGLEKDFVSPID